MDTSVMYRKCQGLWKLAYTSPQTLTFKTPREAQRAKFALYNSTKETRKALHAGRVPNASQVLTLAVQNCEICMSEDKRSLTLQNRSENTFYESMLGQLEDMVEDGGEEQAEEQAEQAEQAPTPANDLAEQLRKLSQGIIDSQQVIKPPYIVTCKSGDSNVNR